MPYRIGLTGNIACGKSTVGQMLAARGAEYVDADSLVHRLMVAGTPETERIVARFGPAVRAADGSIDRAALGAVVWRDPAALEDLETIVHPGVRVEIRRRLAESSAAALVVDAIKLVESGLHHELDALWVVTCIPEQQFRRLMEARGLSEQQARERIAMQPPQEEKVRHATVVIDNSGSLAETERQVDEAWRRAVSSEQ
ncbi:MAG TPA: dephospho-CoA kinase [Chloroflexota bacterium]|nr:dephospho-CoA kinase [Chloroflexota bacterium]